MATNKNKISAVIPDADVTTATGFIAQILALFPFLITLTEAERKTLPKMGPKSVEYVTLNLQGVMNFPELIPSVFDSKEFASDVALVTQLLAIQVPLASLLEKINDSLLAAGSDAMQEANSVYGYLKTGVGTSAVKTLVAQIAERYAAQSKAHSKTTTGGSAPSGK